MSARRPLIALVLAASALAAHAADRPLPGFTTDSAAAERSLESRFDSALRRENLREWMKHLTAHPHHLGSARDHEYAEWIAAKFRSWGYDTQLERFDVLFPTPKTRLLEMTAPERYKARIAEPALKEDHTSNQADEQLPVYNAYSIDGDMTGKVVYVNYGVPKDYDTLAERGIDVKGKIVLARYGGSWRGIKPKVAAEHGAIGCLIYSDPKDDGYFEGDVYPKGAFRNELGAQRGSVADMPLFPGDPLTPGIGATKDAKRLARKDAPTLTKIPVMPISYADATPILKHLGGPVAPAEWRGALPLTYHLGPGAATVHLKLEFNWNTVPCYDVIAKLAGSQYPDEWIIRGNHHDAWVNGADDPISGTVSLMEEARAMSELEKTGWKPKRTIIFAVWDGEEPGLLGSTEWVETHAEELNRKAALYVNSDNNGRGFLRAAGSHTLESFVGDVARDVTDPQTKLSVRDRLRARELVSGMGEEKAAAAQKELRLGALGSGSDYSPFLQHLGIASLDVRYGGENAGGSYHSIYDSYDHYTRFGDPDFNYCLALSQTAGRIVLRAADADVLPLEFTHLADTVDRYVKDISKTADTMREETATRNRLIQDGTLAAAQDPKEPFVLPKPKDSVPYVNLAPLQNASAKLKEAAARYDAAVTKRGLPADPAKRAALDQALISTERAMLGSGLPRRPWYRHQIYAPGFYTGYGVKTLPGVREALEERRWSELDEQVGVTAKALERVAAEIDRATSVVTGP